MWNPTSGSRPKRSSGDRRYSRSTIAIRKGPVPGQYRIVTPYRPSFLEEFKRLVPSSARTWNPSEKVWLVGQAEVRVVYDLMASHFGSWAVDVQQGISLDPKQALEAQDYLLEIHYLGSCKQRTAGEEPLAFGWVKSLWDMEGQELSAMVRLPWGASFPESILRRWFKQEGRPGEALSLFAILGVDETAGPEEIRKAYRRMARQWHPDVCKEPDAKEQFQTIGRAYAILSDSIALAKYRAGLHLMGLVQETPQAVQTYRPPLRCGLLQVRGTLNLTIQVEAIEGWEDVMNEAGDTLVTSWQYGAEDFRRIWVREDGSSYEGDSSGQRKSYGAVSWS